MSAISPTLSPYVSGFGELAYEGRRPWQPVLRLGGVFAPAPDTETSGGTLALSLLAAQLEGCPARFYLGSDIFSASPCVAVEAGALMVTGTSATETVDRTRPWVAGRAIVRLSARVAHAVTLEAQGGLVAPFVHDEFVFEPNTTAHEVPPLGGTFGGGVAFRIW